MNKKPKIPDRVSRKMLRPESGSAQSGSTFAPLWTGSRPRFAGRQRGKKACWFSHGGALVGFDGGVVLSWVEIVPVSWEAVAYVELALLP